MAETRLRAIQLLTYACNCTPALRNNRSRRIGCSGRRSHCFCLQPAASGSYSIDTCFGALVQSAQSARGLHFAPCAMRHRRYADLSDRRISFQASGARRITSICIAASIRTCSRVGRASTDKLLTMQRSCATDEYESAMYSRVNERQRSSPLRSAPT